MNGLLGLAMLAGYYPLSLAWRANRSTTLRPALAWTTAAWSAWAAAALNFGSLTWTYLALSLSGCAGVAVLGARRPGAGAWNFVCAGLLVVLLLPVASGFGTPRLESAHIVFPGAILVVGWLNHLPTRPGVAVSLAGIACTVELARLAGVDLPSEAIVVGRTLLALAPWAAWLALRRPASVSGFDRTWLDFRDRYGFLWAERVREQFNRSAASASWQQRLTWQGLRPVEKGDEALKTMRALLKRFGPADADAT
jgi:hypothetical protein